MNESTHPIRAYRQAQQPPMTLSDLAGLVDLSKATLSRIETGDLPLTIETARKLSDATGIPLRVLMPELAKRFDAEAGATQ